jgi:hypothetical protein
MEQRALQLFLAAVLFFSAAGTIQAAAIRNIIDIDMTAATPTATCTKFDLTSCNSALSNLSFTNIGGVQTLTFNYTSTSNGGYMDEANSSFREYTSWIDNTSTVVGTLLVSGTIDSNGYSVEFCEPSCSTTGFTASPFGNVTVDYTQFQKGFIMDVSSSGTFVWYVKPGESSGSAADVYQVKLDQQAAPEPATLPLMVMAGAFGAFVSRRNLFKAARRGGSSR